MHLPTLSPRRLAGAAVLACAAALIPVAALAATAAPAAPARGQRAALPDGRAGDLAGQRQRSRRDLLLRPQLHQPVRARVHPARPSRGVGGEPRRRPGRHARGLGQPG